MNLCAYTLDYVELDISGKSSIALFIPQQLRVKQARGRCIKKEAGNQEIR